MLITETMDLCVLSQYATKWFDISRILGYMILFIYMDLATVTYPTWVCMDMYPNLCDDQFVMLMCN